ncbi:MAG TPA: adenylate/guanylate cyclase domain-containing protein [Geminicoccaceae bacterium]|mgnify:CR=1 FL=1|nr:adenylate/guanylate cyclase domain-containing protein [Geminicoccus sp.]HMU52828.1 adenylate/guanylate cyclase domain-containing protein [Geminicoccaceae bacterium]
MVQRRLATVLACDVVGYSRMMARDDEGTMSLFATHRALIRQLVAQHRGQPFGAAGDSIYAEFSSPVEAVRCAIDVQLALHDIESARAEGDRMRWRIGINLGDVMAEEGAVVGDGVNVAARLEALARPGGICLSAAVAEHVRDHLEVAFEDLGRQRLKNIGRPIQVFRIPLPSDLDPAPPYHGLVPFEVGESSMFHGRARAVGEATERLARRAAEGCAFLLVHGASGVGKSSLARAGILPALMRPGAIEGVDRWLWATLRPGGAPPALAALAASLAVPEALGGVGISQAEAEALVETIAAEPELASARLRPLLEPARARLLLIVDQLEELLAEEAGGDPRAEAFVRVLAALAGSGFAWIVATMRGDFYHRCSEIPGLAELRDGFGSYELLPPSPSEIGQIIREPARRAGLRFEHSDAEGRLDDVLHEDAVRNRIPLPLLSFTLASLHAAAGDARQLTFADYRRLGGFEGAVAKRAEEVVRDLPPAVLYALPSVIRALVTIGVDGTVTAHAARRADVATNPERRALVDTLAGARLLVVDHDRDGGSELRLAHEALTTHWPRARDQIQSDRELLTIRAALDSEVRRWEREGRSTDFLLPPGRRLAEAEDLLQQRRGELTSPLVAFIEGSRAARDRAARRALNRLRALALGLAVLAGGASWLAWSATTAKGEAERARADAAAALQDAATQRDRAEAANSRLLARRAMEAIDGAKPGLALALALQAMPRAIERPELGPDTPQGAIALLEALTAQRRLAVLGDGSATVDDVAWSPDGGMIATASGDGHARLWDAASGRIVRTLPRVPAELRRVAFSPDGRRLAGVAWDNLVRVWDIGSGSEVATLAGHSLKPTSIAWSPDGQRLLSAAEDGTVRLWEVPTGATIARIEVGEGNLWSARFDPTGETIVSSTEQGILRFFSGRTGAPLARLAAHPRRVWHAAYSPDGSRLVTTSLDGTARLWSTADLGLLAELRGHGDWVAWAAFSPDGRRLATASGDRTVRLWDVATGASLGVIKGHQHRVWSVGFSPDGRRLATASQDGTAQVWDVGGWQLPTAVVGKGETAVTAMAFDAGETMLAIGSAGGAVELREVSTGRLLRRLDGHAAAVRSLSFTGDGRLLGASDDGSVRLWPVDRDGKVSRIDAGTPLRAAALDGSRGLVAAGALDGGIRLWRLAEGRWDGELRGHGAAISSLGFSAGGELLSGSADGTVWRWDLASGTGGTVAGMGDAELPTPVLEGADLARAVADAEQGNVLSVRARAKLAPMRPDIVSLTLGQAAERLAVGTVSGTVLLLDAPSGSEVGLLRSEGGPVDAIAMGRDGRLLAAATRDGLVRIWRAPPWRNFPDLVAQAKAILPQGLTTAERRDPVLDAR